MSRHLHVVPHAASRLSCLGKQCYEKGMRYLKQAEHFWAHISRRRAWAQPDPGRQCPQVRDHLMTWLSLRSRS